ncbi:hypothetical protein BX616_001856 [Lobosporangium transversale]|uniref:BZIP domain-containing protein n=1 Tax=Lobosporangium transversale TaxID=64571 RepID=A0A1Y2GUA0_9FUNG|nr:hypothetical protein BCR41DRAFT_384915 [Lobosporangium transversale]KAF9902668.1 hypothetical protein BX616_001856 [Lobosporangium transversale]ORZ23819.1 hypothetical protein BCR41DRAFT_384915 [Lobosporangium transversale]|eukprot:XP_021883633.1 hypothetical protein BCR41DRAFT_384915 [Lobosporangium transversale]
MAAINTTSTANAVDANMEDSSHISTPEESILSFLTTDFLESQTTHPSDFDQQFFDTLPTDNDNTLKYQDLLHPPSPPTSVGTFSESSGSPQHSNMDSCDEGSTSDVPMDSTSLEYWQYIYSDLTPNSTFPLLTDTSQQQQQQQPGAWPILSNVDGSLLQPSVLAFPTDALLNSNSPLHPNSPAIINPTIDTSNPVNNRTNTNTPPSPASSVKTEKRTKRAKKHSAPPQPVLAPLAPLKPLMPLGSLAQIAPNPAPLSPPNEVFIKKSPSLSPRIIAAPPPPPASNNTNALRRPSIIPAPAQNGTRSNPVLVKSTLIPEEKPQSEAALTAQAKRQERLIKNRAAALLSRKRKREHINLLETHTDLLKTTNQELTERVSELEENVRVLTTERDTAREERDSARKECESLQRQIKVLTHHQPQTDAFHMDMDLERNIRTSVDTDRGLNSKATGVVFMIILFSFALFNLPGGKLETLMVGGSLDRARIGSSIVGRALGSYNKNPTISGQVRAPPASTQELQNMTDLVVFSDNRALQTWLGHQPVTVPSDVATGASDSSLPITSSPVINKEAINEPVPVVDLDTKSVGFLAQNHDQLPWTPPHIHQEMNEPDRDAWLYCSNLLYSLRSSSVSKTGGPAQATNGEIRRPRMSIISPLDGVIGSTTDAKKDQLPPWMPNSNTAENGSEQRYLRLDVEVTSSRVVSGKGLEDHEQVIRFPIIPFSVFDNSTTSLASSKVAAPTPTNTIADSPQNKITRRIRSSRVDAQGKIRRTYNSRVLKRSSAAAAAAQAASEALLSQQSMPLSSIKEEPIEVYIKAEPMD